MRVYAHSHSMIETPTHFRSALLRYYSLLLYLAAHMPAICLTQQNVCWPLMAMWEGQDTWYGWMVNSFDSLF